MAKSDGRRGSAMIEFAFTGVPLIFIWISIVQMSLGMWHYHTLQYATKMAGEYLAFHGANCSAGGNNCGVQIKNVAAVLANNAVGIPPSAIQCTFKALANDHATVCGTPVSCELDNCETNTTAWPPSGCNTAPPSGNDITILAEYQLNPAMGMVTPGSKGMAFGGAWLPAFTHQMILF
jgi:Flp pilus assembly protein TadG